MTRDDSNCITRSDHRFGPVNYVDFDEWARALSETHDQRQCPDCGLWVICAPSRHLHA